MEEWRDRYVTFVNQTKITLEWANGVKQQADFAKAEADSLRAEKEKTDEAARLLRLSNSDLRRKNQDLMDSLTEEYGLDTIPVESLPPVVQPWVKLSFALRSEIDSLNAEIELASQRIDLLVRETTSLRSSLVLQTQRADSLAVVISLIPEAPPQEKFLFFRLPSRKASFLIGTALGVVGGIAVENWVKK